MLKVKSYVFFDYNYNPCNLPKGNEEYTPYSRPPLSKQLWLYENHEEAKRLQFKASWSGGNLVE